MEKEKDIFDRPSKVQNMNFLFEDEPSPQDPDETLSFPASKRARQGEASQTARSSSQRVRKGNANGPSAVRGVQPKKAEPRALRNGQTDPNPVRQAQPKQVVSQKPRQARPTQAQPRQVRASSRNQARSGTEASARRVSRTAADPRGRKKGRTKRPSRFRRFLLIYAAALLVLLVAGMIIFASFLKSLEKSQPSNIAAQAAENLTAGKASSYLKSNADAINCFGEPDDLIAQFAANVDGVKQLSYIENKDYRADAPSYDITADGTTIARLTLEKAGSGSFGLSKWKIATLDIADYMDTASYEFLAPIGTTITINGVELDDKYLSGEESVPEILSMASQYVAIPSYLTYKVAGIAGTPEIKAADPGGNELTITAAGSKYVIGSATSQEFIDSVSTLVDHAVEAWGRHFINMGGNLSAYMLEGSDWYSYIFGGPDMDPILTSLYEFESIADYSFTEKEESNYIRYTKDCFTVDVSYQMRVDFTTDRMSDDNQKLDATWVFITQNEGRDWYLIDCIYR